MHILTRRIPYQSRTDCFSLWFIGDVHGGAASCDEVALAETVQTIKNDPKALWIALGDMAEYISRSDWRYRQEDLAEWLQGDLSRDSTDIIDEEIAWCLAKFAPIADKCLGLITGNHEDKILTQFHRNVHRKFWAGMLKHNDEIVNLGDEALIRLKFDRGGHVTSLVLYVHHGWFAGRKDGSKVNNLHDLFKYWDADIIAVGHGHIRTVAPVVITLGLNQVDELVERRRYGLMTGSYLKTHTEGLSSYASRKGFPPNDVGSVRLYYYPDKHRLVGEL